MTIPDHTGNALCAPESGAGQVRSISARTATRNAIVPNVSAVPRFAAPSSSASERRRRRTRRAGSRGRGRAHRASLRPAASSALDERRDVEAGRPARRGACSAARRPPSARSPRSPCSATKSASALARRASARRAGRSSAARCASSAATSSSMPSAGATARDRDDRRVALAERAQRGVEVAPRAQRDVAEVGLRHDEHVGHLHDPRLEELQRVAGAGLHDDRDGVGDLGDLGLGLADADGLDDDDVERGGERLRGRARRGRQAAEPPAGGGRADEHAAVGGVELDPRAVAEQRAARALRRRVDGEHRDRAPVVAPRAHERATAATTCPAPGGPVTPTTCPRGSPPSAAGETARSSAATSSARSRGSTRFSTAGAARGRRRAGACRGRRRRSRHADAATPLRSATSATMSRMIFVRSKSFGV